MTTWSVKVEVGVLEKHNTVLGTDCGGDGGKSGDNSGKSGDNCNSGLARDGKLHLQDK